MSSNPPPGFHSVNLKELAHETFERVSAAFFATTKPGQVEAIILDSLRLGRNLTPDPEND